MSFKKLVCEVMGVPQVQDGAQPDDDQDDTSEDAEDLRFLRMTKGDPEVSWEDVKATYLH